MNAVGKLMTNGPSEWYNSGEGMLRRLYSTPGNGVLSRKRDARGMRINEADPCFGDRESEAVVGLGLARGDSVDWCVCNSDRAYPDQDSTT